ncbi:putative RlpA-like domain superfamily protein [Plasmopara halstedii]
MHSPDEAGTKYAALMLNMENHELWRCAILDQCPGCGYGGLDLSPEVFEKITEYCLKTGSTEFWVAVQPTIRLWCDEHEDRQSRNVTVANLSALSISLTNVNAKCRGHTVNEADLCTAVARNFHQVPLQTVFTVAETSTHSTPISDNLGFADHLHQLYHSGDVASGPSSILTLQESTLSQQSGNKGFTVASPATSISEASVQDDTSSKNPFSSTIAVIAFVATACVVTGTVVGVAVALHKKRRLLEECKNDNGDMSDDSLGSNFVHVSTPRHQALMMQSVV